ncbi:MAG: hypothetical protein M0Q91_14770 [Methanoregula sp.]|jgi:hypothetical protein|nr:hypothetical protein [Methanoregula sp.]
MVILSDPTDHDRLCFRQDLFRDLRMELGQLKACQIQALTIGVTGAGVMLGLIDKDPGYGRVILFLLPLVIILPLWTIFFDKARTISRMIGFIRIQEEICVKNSPSILIGWETAMKYYWSLKDTVWDNTDGKQEIQERLKETNYSKNKKLKSRSKLLNSFFWATSFIVFALLSVACLLLSVRNLPLDFQKGLIPFSLLSIISIIAIYFFVIRFTPDLIDLQSFVKWIVGVSVLITSFFFIFEVYCMEPSFDSSNFISLELARVLGFNLALAGFIFTAILNFWLFKNLVRARYSTAAFEKRWELIIEYLDNKDSHDRKVIRNKEQQSLK